MTEKKIQEMQGIVDGLESAEYSHRMFSQPKGSD